MNHSISPLLYKYYKIYNESEIFQLIKDFPVSENIDFWNKFLTHQKVPEEIIRENFDILNKGSISEQLLSFNFLKEYMPKFSWLNIQGQLLPKKEMTETGLRTWRNFYDSFPNNETFVYIKESEITNKFKIGRIIRKEDLYLALQTVYYNTPLVKLKIKNKSFLTRFTIDLSNCKIVRRIKYV